VLDKTAESGQYTLSFNPFMGHVALHRHPHTDTREEAAVSQPEPPPHRRIIRDATAYEPIQRSGTDIKRRLGL
jgi:hypothetical protein